MTAEKPSISWACLATNTPNAVRDTASTPPAAGGRGPGADLAGDRAHDQTERRPSHDQTERRPSHGRPHGVPIIIPPPGPGWRVRPAADLAPAGFVIPGRAR
jgi:hypothetical protein